MPQNPNAKRDFEKARDIVRDSGGRVVGRTRLQKIAFLFELTGVGDGFAFEYRHYGPYSEELTIATRNAQLLDMLNEEEIPTSWGGFYSIFTTDAAPNDGVAKSRVKLAKVASAADSVALELAATAAFLASEGDQDPWGETIRRKPEKAQDGKIDEAVELYRELLAIKTPNSLPRIVN